MKLGRTSEIAHCSTCGEEWQGLHTAFKSAEEHTRRTGHTTTGEAAEAFRWSRNDRGGSSRTDLTPSHRPASRADAPAPEGG